MTIDENIRHEDGGVEFVRFAEPVLLQIFESKMPELFPNTRLSHYCIVSKIGEGMGEVYLAEDTRPERRVAISFCSEQ